jgi:Glyoxalase/Bleomycin resistance protein/Dioxygenase superfamily.
MEFTGICIHTNNVPRLVDFYSKVFDLKAEGNEVHSAFHEIKLAIWNPGGINENKFSTSERYFTLMFKVKNVDKEYERLKHLDINIEFTSQPKDYPWGARAFSFKDPDGNNIDFLSSVG